MFSNECIPVQHVVNRLSAGFITFNWGIVVVLTKGFFAYRKAELGHYAFDDIDC